MPSPNAEAASHWIAVYGADSAYLASRSAFLVTWLATTSNRLETRLANNASKGAAVYLQSILERGDGPFDEAWMKETFERLWIYAEKVVGWTNALLLPPPPHVLEVLGAAGQFPAVAHRFANGFDNPPEYYEWFMDPDSAGAYLAEVAAA